MVNGSPRFEILLEDDPAKPTFTTIKTHNAVIEGQYEADGWPQYT
jgi:hypothetical protein